MNRHTPEQYIKNHNYEKLVGCDGVWAIFGESENCDFSESHYQPLLEVVACNFELAVKHAIALPKFYTWGSGGSIESVSLRFLSQSPTYHCPKVLGTSLRDMLKDWTDIDIAMFYVGVSLGLWPNTQETFAVKVKGIVNSNNELGNWLFDVLELFQSYQLIERDDSYGFRWNPNAPEIFSIDDLEDKQKMLLDKQSLKQGEI